MKIFRLKIIVLMFAVTSFAVACGGSSVVIPENPVETPVVPVTPANPVGPVPVIPDPKPEPTLDPTPPVSLGKPVISSFVSDASCVDEDTAIKLSWTVSNQDEVFINDQSLGKETSYTVQNISEDTTFKLVAKNKEGETASSLVIHYKEAIKVGSVDSHVTNVFSKTVSWQVASNGKVIALVGDEGARKVISFDPATDKALDLPLPVAGLSAWTAMSFQTAGSKLFLARAGRVYASGDFGKTWSLLAFIRRNNINLNVTSLYAPADNANVLFVGVQGGLFKVDLSPVKLTWVADNRVGYETIVNMTSFQDNLVIQTQTGYFLQYQISNAAVTTLKINTGVFGSDKFFGLKGNLLYGLSSKGLVTYDIQKNDQKINAVQLSSALNDLPTNLSKPDFVSFGNADYGFIVFKGKVYEWIPSQNAVSYLGSGFTEVSSLQTTSNELAVIEPDGGLSFLKSIQAGQCDSQIVDLPTDNDLSVLVL